MWHLQFILKNLPTKNWITDVIEVNINNLAAVPSIVFRFAGAAIFIGWMRSPLSAPLVGGLGAKLNDFTNGDYYDT